MDGEITLFGTEVFRGIMNGKYNDVLQWINGEGIHEIVTCFPFFYQDYAYFLKYMCKVRNLFQEPYWKCKELKNMESEVKNKYFLVLSKFILPAVSSVRTKVARAETEIDAMKLTLALHIYKNKHGAFPDSLDVLSEVLKSIPHDPFNDKAFEYRKEADYFSLSSEWLAERERIFGRKKK